MGFFDWLFGKPGADPDVVDHSIDPKPTYRTEGVDLFYSEPLIPMIKQCMEHYRVGPPEGQVYSMMLMVLEEAKANDYVRLSHEEMYFIQQAGVTPEELFRWRV